MPWVIDPPEGPEREDSALRVGMKFSEVEGPGTQHP